MSVSDGNSNMQIEIDNLKKADKDILDKLAAENEDLRNKVSLVDQENQDQNKIIDALENSIKEQQLNIVNLHETTTVFQEQAKYVEAVEAKVAKVEELRQQSANDSKNDLEKAIAENKNHIDESITNILIKINALNDQSDMLKGDTEKLGEVIEDIQDKVAESKTQLTEEINVFQSNIQMSIKADQENNTTVIESTLDHLKEQMKKFDEETEKNNEKLMIDIKGGDDDLKVMIGDLNSRLEDEVNKISNNIVTMNVSVNDGNSNMQIEIDNLKKTDKDILDKLAAENEDLRNKVSLVDQENLDQNKIIDALENSIKEQQLNIVNLHETTNVFQEQAKYVEAVEAKVASVESEIKKNLEAAVLDNKDNIEKLRVGIDEALNDIEEKFNQTNVSNINEINVKIHDLNTQAEAFKNDTDKLEDTIENIQGQMAESRNQLTEEINVFQSNIQMSIKADQENKISNNIVTMNVSVSDGNSNMQIEIDNLKKADKDILDKLAAENEDLRNKVSLVDQENQDQNKILDALENSIKEQQLNIVNLDAAVLDNKDNNEKLRVGIDEALNDIEEKLDQTNVTNLNEINVKIHDLNAQVELKM